MFSEKDIELITKNIQGENQSPNSLQCQRKNCKSTTSLAQVSGLGNTSTNTFSKVPTTTSQTPYKRPASNLKNRQLCNTERFSKQHYSTPQGVLQKQKLAKSDPKKKKGGNAQLNQDDNSKSLIIGNSPIKTYTSMHKREQSRLSQNKDRNTPLHYKSQDAKCAQLRTSPSTAMLDQEGPINSTKMLSGLQKPSQIKKSPVSTLKRHKTPTQSSLNLGQASQQAKSVKSLIPTVSGGVSRLTRPTIVSQQKQVKSKIFKSPNVFPYPKFKRDFQARKDHSKTMALATEESIGSMSPPRRKGSEAASQTQIIEKKPQLFFGSKRLGSSLKQQAPLVTGAGPAPTAVNKTKKINLNNSNMSKDKRAASPPSYWSQSLYQVPFMPAANTSQIENALDEESKHIQSLFLDESLSSIYNKKEWTETQNPNQSQGVSDAPRVNPPNDLFFVNSKNKLKEITKANASIDNQSQDGSQSPSKSRHAPSQTLQFHTQGSENDDNPFSFSSSPSLKNAKSQAQMPQGENEEDIEDDIQEIKSKVLLTRQKPSMSGASTGSGTTMSGQGRGSGFTSAAMRIHLDLDSAKKAPRKENSQFQTFKLNSQAGRHSNVSAKSAQGRYNTTTSQGRPSLDSHLNSKKATGNGPQNSSTTRIGTISKRINDLKSQHQNIVQKSGGVTQTVNNRTEGSIDPTPFSVNVKTPQSKTKKFMPIKHNFKGARSGGYTTTGNHSNNTGAGPKTKPDSGGFSSKIAKPGYLQQQRSFGRSITGLLDQSDTQTNRFTTLHDIDDQSSTQALESARRKELDTNPVLQLKIKDATNDETVSIKPICLKSLLNEEQILKKMYNQLSQYSAVEMRQLLDQWWKLTDNYEICLFEEYFTSEKTQKLMKQYQLTLILTTSLLLTYQKELTGKDPKYVTNFKNLLTNAIQNYSIFIAEIYQLIEQQFSFDEVFLDHSYYIMKIKEDLDNHERKNYYKSKAIDRLQTTMKRNNEFMLAILKRLCRTEKKTSPVVINAYTVVKRIESMKVKKCRELIAKTLDYVKTKGNGQFIPGKSIMRDMLSPMNRPSKQARENKSNRKTPMPRVPSSRVSSSSTVQECIDMSRSCINSESCVESVIDKINQSETQTKNNIPRIPSSELKLIEMPPTPMKLLQEPSPALQYKPELIQHEVHQVPIPQRLSTLFEVEEPLATIPTPMAYQPNQLIKFEDELKYGSRKHSSIQSVDQLCGTPKSQYMSPKQAQGDNDEHLLTQSPALTPSPEKEIPLLTPQISEKNRESFPPEDPKSISEPQPEPSIGNSNEKASPSRLIEPMPLRFEEDSNVKISGLQLTYDQEITPYPDAAGQIDASFTTPNETILSPQNEEGDIEVIEVDESRAEESILVQTVELNSDLKNHGIHVENFMIESTTEQAIVELRASDIINDDESNKDDEETQTQISDDEMPKPNPPYLTNRMLDGFKYTLVLDLDETLIHYEDPPEGSDEEGYYLVRPHAMKFLRELCEIYELVIFTAAVHQIKSTQTFLLPTDCIVIIALKQDRNILKICQLLAEI